MFRRVNVFAAVASLFVLAACSQGAPPAQTGSAVMPAAIGAGVSEGAKPGGGCTGSHQVKVTPCPITLTKRTKSGIVVTVSGPGVVNSYLRELNGCFSHKLCYNVDREGSSYTKWRFTSGKYCGGASVPFEGVNASGTVVGNFFLKLSNRYCPRTPSIM
jgi:hypothetical protein